MARDQTRSHAASDELCVGEAPPRTQACVKAREADPVQAPDGYARTVLHHAVTHGDLLEEGADGTVTIVLKLSRREFDRLNSFDPDGDADREPVRVAAESCDRVC